MSIQLLRERLVSAAARIVISACACVCLSDRPLAPSGQSVAALRVRHVRLGRHPSGLLRPGRDGHGMGVSLVHPGAERRRRSEEHSPRVYRAEGAERSRTAAAADGEPGDGENREELGAGESVRGCQPVVAPVWD